MRKLIAGLCLTLACWGATAHAQSYSRAAKQVLAQAQAASGGRAWLGLRGLHETGRQNDVDYEGWFDPMRYGARVETREAAGLRVHGFNGTADWQILPNGQIIGVNDRATMAQARTDAFLAVNGVFFPSRFGADAALLGVRSHKGRAFDVLKVDVLHGESRELWFDRRTHLLGRIIDRTGAAPVAVELSDYRRVGPFMLPFRYASDRGGRLEERQLNRIALTPVDRHLFSWDPPATRAAGSAP
jgi:hypothetical protein